MKNTFFLLISVFLFSPVSGSYFSVHDAITATMPQADQWADTVITHVEQPLVEELIELLYASYMRSYMTLIVQRDYIRLLTRIGSGWNHIISTRLNPSNDREYDTAAIALDDTILEQVASFQSNCIVQRNYVERTDRLVHNTDARFKTCNMLVDELREHARTAVAETLIGMMDEIQQEIQKAQQLVSQAAEFFKTEGQLKNSAYLTKSITELLWYYVPHLMVSSFVNFDKGYTAASKGCLNAYLESQQISNDIWHQIEVARASYYAAHYAALYSRLQNISHSSTLPESSMMIQQLADYTCSL